ncbi:MAG: hypothetical protein KAZ87_08365 [Spirochaetes bacterium]|nr:hypothetical protein [Spirochaetota bacterium]
MKKALLIITVASFFSGCSGLLKDKVLKDPGKNFQISIPASWKTMTDLSEDADIQAGNSIEGKYLMVYIEKKEDFADFNDLDGYAALTLKNWTSRAGDITTEKHEELTIDGMKAKSFFVNDSDKGTLFRNIVTFIESDTFFVQVVIYSERSKFDNYLKEFKKVSGTFKKIVPTESKTEK